MEATPEPTLESRLLHDPAFRQGFDTALQMFTTQLEAHADALLVAEHTNRNDHLSRAEWRGAQIEVKALARELREAGTMEARTEGLKHVYA